MRAGSPDQKFVDEVHEMFSSSHEDLPPVGVGTSDNNILGVSTAVDIPRVIV
jgi:hypothetical protein